MGRRRKVARSLKYGPGSAWPRTNGPDDDTGGGAGVQEPRRPLPPSPVLGQAVPPRPEPPAVVRLSDPAEPDHVRAAL